MYPVHKLTDCSQVVLPPPESSSPHLEGSQMAGPLPECLIQWNWGGIGVYISNKFLSDADAALQ